jgi:hypothetical protein
MIRLVSPVTIRGEFVQVEDKDVAASRRPALDGNSQVLLAGGHCQVGMDAMADRHVDVAVGRVLPAQVWRQVDLLNREEVGVGFVDVDPQEAIAAGGLVIASLGNIERLAGNSEAADIGRTHAEGLRQLHGGGIEHMDVAVCASDEHQAVVQTESHLVSLAAADELGIAVGVVVFDFVDDLTVVEDPDDLALRDDAEVCLALEADAARFAVGNPAGGARIHRVQRLHHALNRQHVQAHGNLLGDIEVERHAVGAGRYWLQFDESLPQAHPVSPGLLVIRPELGTGLAVVIDGQVIGRHPEAERCGLCRHVRERAGQDVFQGEPELSGCHQFDAGDRR